MYVKIEPTGTSEQSGLVRVRFSMYLDEGDYGYEKHLVTITDDGKAVDPVTGLTYGGAVPGPTTKQVNPFHNHFYYFEATTPNDEIFAVAEAFLHEAYVKWAQDLPLDLINPPVKFHPGAGPVAIARCENKAAELCTLTSEVKVNAGN